MKTLAHSESIVTPHLLLKKCFMSRIVSLFLIPVLSIAVHAADDRVQNVDGIHSTRIEASIAKEAGVRLSTAQSGSIKRHIQIYGRLVTPPTHHAQVQARFPGLIVSLKANTGDAVTAGQVLAIVESNESLRRYEVKAPISGVIQERWLNQGQITTDAPLFTLVNQNELWAELNIFPSQRHEIQVGQHVHVRHNGHDHDSIIASITPALASGTNAAMPYVIARVLLNNKHHDMAPGDKVMADIGAEEVPVAVRVEKVAIQEMDGQPVVFIHKNATYEASPVVLGVQDDSYVEIKHGLQQGDEYVLHNSYLLKADIDKSEAEH